MQRRVVAITLAGVVLLGGLASAIVLLGPPKVKLVASAEDADHVTLYQNGLAFVQLTRTFLSEGGETFLTFPLPTTARFDSLVLESDEVVVKQLRSTLAARASLEPGEQVLVHARDTRTFEGTYLGEEMKSLMLATAQGITMVRLDEVIAVEVVGRDVKSSGPGTVEVVALVDAPTGAHRVNISYLAQGAGWTPSYELDVETGAFTFFATLTGLDDWDGVVLDLVSGAPRVVLQPVPTDSRAFKMFATAADEAASAPGGFAPSTPLGDLHRYRYDVPIDLRQGETMRLIVAQGDVEVLREYHHIEATTGWGGFEGAKQRFDAQYRVEIQNLLGEPLPPGIVRAYRDRTWVGEDMMQSTPRGERANLTLSGSMDVTAHMTLVDVVSNGNTDTYEYSLRVKNGKADTVDARTVLSWPGYRTSVLSIVPPADERTGTSAAWDDRLAPGAENEYRVRYQQSRT